MSTCIPLDLDDYRTLINLDESSNNSITIPETEREKSGIVDELLSYLQSETDNGSAASITGANLSLQAGKRSEIYSLLTVREPEPLPRWFLAKMNGLLQMEAREKFIVDAANLPRIDQTLPDSNYEAASNCTLWRGDITTLRVDAIVNAAKSSLLGCFRPFHKCIDNVIHAAAGPQVRRDCHVIITEQRCPDGTGWAKVTRGYNLPSRYILHTVGPIFNGSLSPEQDEQLASSYQSCLDLAHRLSLKSIAFCSISTGEFGFPVERGAEIALETADEWLKNHPDSIETVIFNVFSQKDQETYTNVLKRI